MGKPTEECRRAPQSAVSAMERRGIKFGTFLTILAVLVGIYYRSLENPLQTRLTAVLKALEKVESKHEIPVRRKVAIGYGICTDVYIDAKSLLHYSNDIGNPEHFDEITTREQLLKSFAYYFRYGAAAERYMPNTTLFDELVSQARSFPSSYSTIGGNAAVMAFRFLREGCDVMLAATMTQSLHQMIPESIKVVGGRVDRDDTHLVLEYKNGEYWGPYSSVRANRYIIHNDVNNPMVSSLDEFDTLLTESRPDLFVVSGLQVMDNYPYVEGQRRDLLLKIKKQMISQSESTKIHFEMASFVEESLLSDLINLLIPYTDSLGMNEQELANLYSSMYYGNISLVTNSNPRVATVLDQMRTLLKLMWEKGQSFENARKLSRIHVHTLAYQAILIVKNSAWQNLIAAAAKASLTANRHVCGSSDVDLHKAALIMDDSFSTSIKNGKRIPFNVDKPVSCWEELIKCSGDTVVVEVCVAPVLVCTKASQTAGGGDNISSAGLVLQI
ncbi:ADP-dependent glucokinase [Orussus abietinus]|uniref:ADP-dependent glucokinase n=1 Tax=Orussus abietinus TaxID=222816 RepID=UPI0006264F91|nr:ADP-dependent glucokinase [Orussus abietinus]